MPDDVQQAGQRLVDVEVLLVVHASLNLDGLMEGWGKGDIKIYGSIRTATLDLWIIASWRPDQGAGGPRSACNKCTLCLQGRAHCDMVARK